MHTRWLRAGVLAMLACAAFSAPAQVADHGHGPAPRPEHFDARTAHYDARFDHGHYYPPRGVYVHQLPPAPVLINHPSGRFYYSGGVWYAPRGPRFVVVPAPLGVFVPVLPAYYTTIWYGGMPYYYANDTYYNWSPAQNSYEVVQPPADVEQQATTQPPPSDELFVYPQRGQSDEQQSTDKYECHKWAAGQSGFDPTQSGGGVAADQSGSMRTEYQRALQACLAGRGYSVR